jgi:hypothetical protein
MENQLVKIQAILYAKGSTWHDSFH